MKTKLTFLIFYFTTFILFTQEAIIHLTNPSFEDFPRAGRLPNGWIDYNLGAQSPPDTQPGSFEVYTQPHHGQAYIGMVTREDGTREAFYQKLKKPLVAGNCYQFSIYLAKASDYLSPNLFANNGYTNLNHPITLNIRGTDKLYVESIELASTNTIEHLEWIPYTFFLSPNINIKYLIFEANYPSPDMVHAGNILLDDMTSIERFDCVQQSELMDSIRNMEMEALPTDLDHNELAYLADQQHALAEQIQYEWPEINYNPRHQVLYRRARDFMFYLEEETNLICQNKIITIGIIGNKSFYRIRKAAFEDFLLQEELFDWLQYNFISIEDETFDYNWIAKNNEFAIAIDYYPNALKSGYYEEFVINNWEKVSYNKEAEKISRLSATILGDLLRKLLRLGERIKIGIRADNILKSKKLESIKEALEKQNISLKDIDFIVYDASENWLVENEDYAIGYK